MRRPSIACRQAVQSLQSPRLQHIWISDELLSSTLHQFFPSPCPHQKRHGSHVPGPLEARRRAAKRRMTVSANFYPQDIFPSSFNLGALFGFRSNPNQPSWRYEPPSPRIATEPLSPAWDITVPQPTPDPPNQTPAPPTSPNSSLREAAYSFPQSLAHLFGEPGTSARDGVKLEETTRTIVAEEPMQTINVESNTCFETFRARITVANKLADAKKHIFLAMAFQECCPAPSNVWVYTALAIRHLLELGWDPKPILEQDSISSLSAPLVYSGVARDLLLCLKEVLVRYPHCSKDIYQVHLKLAQSNIMARRSYTKHDDSMLLMLVRDLWHTAHMQSSKYEDSTIHLLCSVVSKVRCRFRRRQLHSILSNITQMEQNINHLIIRNAWDDSERINCGAHVLSCLPGKLLFSHIPTITLNFAKAATRQAHKPNPKSHRRIRNWLQVLDQLDLIRAPRARSSLNMAITWLAKHSFAHRSIDEDRTQILVSALRLKASRAGALDRASKEKVEHILHNFELQAEHSDTTPDALFGMLMSELQKQKLPHEPLARMIIDLLVRHGGLKDIFAFLQALHRLGLTMANTKSIHKLLKRKAATIRRSSVVTQKARQQRAYILQISQKIVKVLSRISSVSKHLKPELNSLQAEQQFRHILDRAQADHALPLQYRNININISPTERVYLIHQLAHQYSLDNTRSQRDAWRAIFYHYKHLEQHSLPIGPLFTKAVTRISITRPLSENRFVSAKRLIWVCQLVARVEGEEVAQKIETNFWHWRGDLIRYSKGVFVGGGGDTRDRVRVGRMKALGLI
ncbi:hypothetical protein GQ44DRAFT_613317 [Phaeosphaeriaceae sp. PMI808]|nr:hypothetical protein GQ44DRAFT_613317 [Phaeosphaeriaceae sp. PMI808]